MRRIAIILFLWASFLTLSNAREKEPVRAVWLTTIGGIDWPRSYASTQAGEERQKRELTDMLDRLQKVGINTVLLQTRVRATVIYPSRYEPWDGCIAGRVGRAPTGYDPLRFAISEAHRRGMELHAWVVTIPAGKWNSAGCRELRKRHPSMLRKIGDEGYMNPEREETAEYLADICAEIARNYDVDGIHLDYIRYPETWRLNISKERARGNITNIVRRIHTRVKSIKPGIKLSCSPIGKYGDLRRYSSNGWNAYDRVCQDAQGWLRTGIMDQLYPMMYFRGNNFYPFALNWQENNYGHDIVPGLGIYFLDPKEGRWNINEVKRQLYFLRSQGMGFCLFRTKFLLDNVQGIYDFLRNEYPLSAQLQKKETDFRGYSQMEIPTTFLRNDGKTMELPEKGPTMDASYIVFESLTGTSIATRPYLGKSADIRTIPNGIYTLRSLNKKGVRHKIGMVYIRRQE
ncbi:MAG: family 10 glycosylhydrolase [Prevotella sp.]|nr:family 10 glycosylhydrolase [Prevotella sp.]